VAQSRMLSVFGMELEEVERPSEGKKGVCVCVCVCVCARVCV